MSQQDAKERIKAAYDLLSAEWISRDAFEQVRTFTNGLNTNLDKTLDKVSESLSHYEKFSNSEIIELTAEFLPEQTEKQKKRKKALLFLIQNWGKLKTEVGRMKTELENVDKQQSTHQEKVKSFGRIAAYAKGPFGIITIIALVIVVGLIYVKSNIQKTNSQPKTPLVTPSPKNSIKGIIVNNKKIPLTELFVGHGPDCDSPHYHGLSEVSVKTTDGSLMTDPGGCGFGKVKDVSVIDVQ